MLSVLRALLVDGVLLALSASVGLTLSRRLGVTSEPVQLIYALAVPCIAGWLSAAAHLASPAAGRWITAGLYGLVIAAGAVMLRRGPAGGLTFLRSWAPPAGMIMAAAAFSLGLGFVHGIGFDPVATAAARYVHQLPVDNDIPRIMAQALASTVRPLPHPLYDVWSASDRPPV